MNQRAVAQLGLLDALAAKVPENEFLERLEELVEWTSLRGSWRRSSRRRQAARPWSVFKMLRFRQRPAQAGLHERLLGLVNAQLEERGLVLGRVTLLQYARRASTG